MIPRLLVVLGIFLLSTRTVHIAFASEEETPDESFFLKCSSGQVDELREIFKAHPHFVKAATEHGESCLHLTGIYGKTEVTKLLLDLGADPNVRSTFEQGLRMHPLSWNVYGNHYENAKLLLAAGADVNADFDLVIDAKTNEKEVVTVLDIVRKIKGDGTDFDELENLLLTNGAKTMAELKSGESKDDL